MPTAATTTQLEELPMRTQLKDLEGKDVGWCLLTTMQVCVCRSVGSCVIIGRTDGWPMNSRDDIILIYDFLNALLFPFPPRSLFHNHSIRNHSGWDFLHWRCRCIVWCFVLQSVTLFDFFLVIVVSQQVQQGRCIIIETNFLLDGRTDDGFLTCSWTYFFSCVPFMHSF